MKTLKCLAAIALAVTTRTSGAQLVDQPLPGARFGFTAGINQSTFAGDGLGPTSNRHGFVGGLVLVTPFTPSLSTQLEALYSMKGMKSLGPNSQTYSMFKVDYIELPLLFRGDAPISSPVKPFAFTGPSFNFRVSCGADAWLNGNERRISCDEVQSLFSTSDSKFRSLDVGWVFGGGLGFEFHNRRISFGARYELGLRTLSNSGSSKNRALSFMASVEAPLPRRTGR
jgi:hypothetical protein